MPERHHRSVRRFSRSPCCEHWGCPDQAAFETCYDFQHEGDRRPTHKTKRLCHRHAQEWALQYHVEWPSGDALYTPPEPTFRPENPDSTRLGTLWSNPRARLRAWIHHESQEGIRDGLWG
jgi:hypothetical protein